MNEPSETSHAATEVAHERWVACSQCGMGSENLDHEDDLPEVGVLAENFGQPWLYYVRCRICNRWCKGVGLDGAKAAWARGAHHGQLDPDGTMDGAQAGNSEA